MISFQEVLVLSGFMCKASQVFSFILLGSIRYTVGTATLVLVR